jgi:hypothetical protein
MYTKNCLNCTTLFTSKHKEQKYCSNKCSSEQKVFNRTKKGEGSQINNCLYCNEEFFVYKCILKRGNLAGQFCSPICRVNYIKGKNNPNWRGGEINDAQKQRERRIYTKEVRKRDNYTCQECGKPEENGIAHDVHHIIPYRLTQDNSLSNLITLCHSCHMKEAAKELKLYKQ